MLSTSKIKLFSMVLVIAALIQIGLVMMDCQNTPYWTAINFVRAYYKLDPSMVKYLSLCDMEVDPSIRIAEFIQRKREEMQLRGFDLAMAKSALYHIKTETVYNNSEAEVVLTAYRKTSLNSIFFYVANLFNLGKVYEVRETLKLKKEDNRWLVCNHSLYLPLKN